jgi:hypothetical protein
VIKSWRMRWAGHVARMGECWGVYMVLVGWPEGKRPLVRPRHRWEDNIKMDLKEIGIDWANWIRLAQDRIQWQTFVTTMMILRVPLRNQVIFWQGEWPLAFQRTSCTMEWVRVIVRIRVTMNWLRVVLVWLSTLQM